MRRMRRIFVAMAAGVLAFAEILGYEVPERELEPESEVTQEKFQKPVLRDPNENASWSFAPEQPHTHTEVEADFAGLPVVVAESGKHSVRYFLWLSPVFDAPLPFSSPGLAEQTRHLARVEKRGNPVTWESDGVQGRWQDSRTSAEMLGPEPDLLKLHEELKSSLHLPSQQVERLIAVLLADQSVMVGGDWPEEHKSADLDQLRSKLEQEHAMSSAEADTVLAVVSGENPSVRELVNASQTFAAVSKSPEEGTAFRIPAAPVPKFRFEPVQQAIPRLSDTLSSLRTFSEEELTAFGMRPKGAVFTSPLPPGSSASPPDSA